MTVFLELEVQDFQRTFQKQVKNSKVQGRRSGAGEANVRRPLRGIEIKDNTYSVIRVIQADGTELPLFDSSNSAGHSTRYANFLLQSVQEARMEKHQIVETFGDPYIYFFGESPRFIDVSAVVLNTLDFNWEAEWWSNYETYLRGTKLTELGARLYLFYDETIVEGYMMQAQAVKSSDQPYLVQLNFRMFVTNYANVSLVGDPFYPVRASIDIPPSIDLTSADSISRLWPKQPDSLPDPQGLASQVFTTYLKSVGAMQIQQQIANAQSLEQAQAAQRAYELQQLGINTPSLLGAIAGEGSSLLKTLKTKGWGAMQNQIGMDAEKALTHAKDQVEHDFLAAFGASAESKFPITTNPAALGRVYTDNLATILRQALYYSTPYPGQNIESFIQNAQLSISQQATLNPDIQRAFPLRGRIASNFDEYTQYAGHVLDLPFSTLTALNNQSSDPHNTISDEICKRGGTADASSFYAMGLIGWSPGQGFSSASGSGTGLPGLGSPGLGIGQATGFAGTGNGTVAFSPWGNPPTGAGGYVLGFGHGFRPSFSRSPGSTVGVGGAYGGQLGGQIGPGVGGALGGFGALQLGNPAFQQYGTPLQQQFAQSSGGASGGPYGLGFGGGGPAAQGAYQYTGGFSPDGSWQGTPVGVGGPSGLGSGGFGTGTSSGFGVGIGVGIGAGNGGSGIFGGGANMSAIAGLNSRTRGDGVFGIQALPGTLDPSLMGGQNQNCDNQTSSTNAVGPDGF